MWVVHIFRLLAGRNFIPTRNSIPPDIFTYDFRYRVTVFSVGSLAKVLDPEISELSVLRFMGMSKSSDVTAFRPLIWTVWYFSHHYTYWTVVLRFKTLLPQWIFPQFKTINLSYRRRNCLDLYSVTKQNWLYLCMEHIGGPTLLKKTPKRIKQR